MTDTAPQSYLYQFEIDVSHRNFQLDNCSPVSSVPSLSFVTGQTKLLSVGRTGYRAVILGPHVILDHSTEFRLEKVTLPRFEGEPALVTQLQPPDTAFPFLPAKCQQLVLGWRNALAECGS